MRKLHLLQICILAAVIALSAGCVKGTSTNPTDQTVNTSTITPTITVTTITTATLTSTITPLTTATPTATITITATITDGVNIVVSMQMMDNNGIMGTEQFVIHAIDNAGATLNVSSVTLAGPTGPLAGTITDSVYTFTAPVTTDYVPSGSYTVTVGYNAVNYTGTFSLPGNMAIAADGSTVTWPGSATIALITVIKPNMTSSMFGPAISSPVDLNTLGVYSLGAGTYTITSAVTFITPFAVTNGATGIATSLQTRIKMVMKF